MRIVTALFLLTALIVSASDSRMQEILAMFSKSKHVHKQKRGVLKSVFLERHAEPIAGGAGVM